MNSHLLMHSVAEALTLSPDLVKTLLAYQTDCVGCVMAGYCNFYDVMDFYGLTHEEFGKKVIEILSSKRMQLAPVNGKGG